MAGLEKLAAMADTSGLGSFDGQDILRTSIAITNAGDGLSAALAVDPQILHMGDKVTVVIECVVGKVSLVPVDKETPGGPVVRQHTLKAGNATLLDDAAAGEMAARLDAQAERIRVAREDAAGLLRLQSVSDDETDAPFGGAVVNDDLDADSDWESPAPIGADEQDSTMADVDDLRARRKRGPAK